MPPSERSLGVLPKSIETIWKFHATGEASTLVLPDGRCDCLVRGRMQPDGSVDHVTPVVTGPATTAAAIPCHPDDVWVGVRLRPEAARLVWGHRTRQAEDQVVRGRYEVSLLVPQLASMARRHPSPEAMHDELTAIVASLEDAAPLDAACGRLTTLLHDSGGTLRVHELAADVGWSVRHLTRRFHMTVGLSPKRYAAVIRMHCALHALLVRGRDASVTAAECGYADQAHLVRDIRRHTGMTPSRLPPSLPLPPLPIRMS